MDEQCHQNHQRVKELQELMDQAVLQDAIVLVWSDYNPETDSAVHKLKRAVLKPT